MKKLFRRIGAKSLLVALNKLDAVNNTVTTYRVKPLATAEDLIKTDNTEINNVGILIQGQLVPYVTLRTCKRYRSLYPKSKIAFSTWEEVEHGDIQKIAALGIEVIRNRLPDSAGPSNVNLQIISTKTGLDFLAQAGVKKVLKNRSDGMLSSDFLLEYLLYLFEKFSENGKKIIIPGYNSFLFRMYSPTDQFQFGHIDALQKYWSCPLAESAKIEFRFAESYLVREYLLLHGRGVTFTIEDSLSVYRDFFVVADNAELGLVLNKGTKSEVSNRWANDGFPQTFSEIHFWNWLELETDLERYVQYYEDLSTKPNY